MMGIGFGILLESAEIVVVESETFLGDFGIVDILYSLSSASCEMVSINRTVLSTYTETVKIT